MPNNFISQSAPASDGLVVDANTRFLMRFEGAAGSTIFTDDVGHVITKSGNPTIQKGVVLEGSSSGIFDGVNDFLTIPGTDFTFAGDFSIEFIFQLVTFGSPCGIIGNRNANAQGHWMFSIIGQTSPIWYVNANTYVQGLVTYSPGVKYKVQLVRKNNVCTMYINDAPVGNPVSYAGVVGLSNLPIGIGCYGNGTSKANAIIDQVRISDIARV